MLFFQLIFFWIFYLWYVLKAEHYSIEWNENISYHFWKFEKNDKKYDFVEVFFNVNFQYSSFLLTINLNQIWKH